MVMHMVRNKILVVAADSYSPQQLAAVRDGKEPRIDFLEAAQVMGADLLTFDSLRHSSAGGASGETPEMDYEHIKHPNPWLAPRPEKLRRALRLMMDLTKYAYELADRYDAILLTGEDLGIPLAMRYRQNARRARIVMIAHYLNPLKKQLFLKFSRLGKFIQKVVTYSPAQHLFCLERLGFPEGRIELIPFHADTRFYCPAEVEREPDLLVSAGFERRDYAALFDAIRGTSFRLELGVGSPWSRFRKSPSPFASQHSEPLSLPFGAARSLPADGGHGDLACGYGIPSGNQRDPGIHVVRRADGAQPDARACASFAGRAGRAIHASGRCRGNAARVRAASRRPRTGGPPWLRGAGEGRRDDEHDAFCHAARADLRGGPKGFRFAGVLSCAQPFIHSFAGG